MIARKLCLHSRSHFLQSSLYFIRLRSSRKNCHSCIYFLLNLGHAVFLLSPECASQRWDPRGVFSYFFGFRPGFLNTNNIYDHSGHLLFVLSVFGIFQTERRQSLSWVVSSRRVLLWPPPLRCLWLDGSIIVPWDCHRTLQLPRCLSELQFYRSLTMWGHGAPVLHAYGFADIPGKVPDRSFIQLSFNDLHL